MEIFRAGSHMASSGRLLNFTAYDLIASAHAYNHHADLVAPVVLGHPTPEADQQKGGRVNALAVSGSSLYALSEIEPWLVDAVRAGRYKKVSASFHTPDSPANPLPGVFFLRHVGMLGAQPPAIKGLRPLEFAETQFDLVEVARLEFMEREGFDGAYDAASCIPGLNRRDCEALAELAEAAKRRKDLAVGSVSASPGYQRIVF